MIPTGNTSTDENGNSYQWDALNRLTKITYPSTAYSTFAYDGLSRRTQIAEYNSAHTLTSTKNYLWLGSDIAEERDTTNTVTKRFYAQGEQQSGANYYYTFDHLGSVREMLNSSGTIVARYSYDPYGRTTLVSGSNLATLQYTGDYYHVTSGLNLTFYRAYDPNTARWLSRDPAGENRGLDLYDYVENAPLSRTDWLGLAWTEGPGTIKLTSLWTSTGVRYDLEAAGGEGVRIADDIFGEYAASATVMCTCNGQQKQASGTRVAEKDLNMKYEPMHMGFGLPQGNPFAGSLYGLIAKLFGAAGKSSLPQIPIPTAQQAADIANHVKGALPSQSDTGDGWNGGKSPCSKL